MDYPTAKTTNATELKKYQWDALHDPKKLIAPWMQNEEEGAYVWTFWNKKHTLLFNHIYDYHKTSNQYYLDKIKKSTTDNIALEYNTKSLYKDEQEFIKNWYIGTYSGEKIAKSVFDKIKNTSKNSYIESMNLTANRVYLGSFEVENKTYPTAIYAVKNDLSKLKKIVVTDSETLTNQNKIDFVFCDETYIKYLIVAFYEENAPSDDPSLIIQIEKFVGDDTKDKWLKYLRILGTEKEKEGNTKDEIVLDIEGNWWIGQCNEYFKTETCWNDNCSKNQCCNKAANKILENAGTSTNRTQQIIIAKSNNSDCSGLIGKPDEFQEAIKIIDKSLKEHNLPIMIGVQHPYYTQNKWIFKCSGNTPKVTNHYVIIRGKKYDNEKKQFYYLFYEVGTSSPDNGKSSNNRLYINNTNNLIEGKTAYRTTYTGDYYVVTEVRKNINQKY